MATQWQGSHFIVLLGASALAFGAGYMVAGRNAPRTVALPPATNTSNGVAGPTGIPGFGTNSQTPAPRGRVDENELIARNAEPEDGAQPQRPPAARGEEPGGTERRRPPREEPPEEPYEEDPGYGPEE
ncbi:hypothetical protein [Sphingosinicella sp.]|uniref:hypothetical protein n=1 Tax=Sphingosinicella sp. TaxID=1917971 RepID=UPI004037B104